MVFFIVFLSLFFLQTKHRNLLYSKKSYNMPCDVSCLSVSFTFICDAHLLSSFNNWKSFPNLSFSSYTFCTTFLCDKTFYHPHLRVGNNFSWIRLSVCLSFCNFWVTGARDIIWVYRYLAQILLLHAYNPLKVVRAITSSEGQGHIKVKRNEITFLSILNVSVCYADGTPSTGRHSCFSCNQQTFLRELSSEEIQSCMVGCLSLIWGCSLVSNQGFLVQLSYPSKLTKFHQMIETEQNSNVTNIWLWTTSRILIDVMYTICSANDTTPADWNHLVFNSSLTFYHHVQYVFHDFCIFYFTPKFLATDRIMMLLSVLNILHSSSGNNSTKVD